MFYKITIVLLTSNSCELKPLPASTKIDIEIRKLGYIGYVLPLCLEVDLIFYSVTFLSLLFIVQFVIIFMCDKLKHVQPLI